LYTVPPEVFEVARALGEQTRFEIFCFISEADQPVSVQDLVDEFSMHHSAIRSHLAKLEDAGLLKRDREHEEGTAGRPRLMFTPSQEEHSVSIPPRQYRLLADLALQYGLSRSAGWKEVEEFGTAWGKDYARQLSGKSENPLLAGEALELLVNNLPLFDDFMASADAPGSRYALSGTNCPFAELAEHYDPLVCTLHQNAIRGALEELTGQTLDWTRVSRMVDGDAACVIRAEDPSIPTQPAKACDTGDTAWLPAAPVHP